MLRGQPRGPGLYHIPPSPLLFRRRRTIRCEKPSSVMSRDQPWRRGCGLSRPQAGVRSPAGDQGPGGARPGGRPGRARVRRSHCRLLDRVRSPRQDASGGKGDERIRNVLQQVLSAAYPGHGRGTSHDGAGPGPAQKQRQSGRPAPCRYVTQMAPFARPLRGLCLDIARLLPGRSPGPDFRTVGRHAETAL